SPRCCSSSRWLDSFIVGVNRQRRSRSLSRQLERMKRVQQPESDSSSEEMGPEHEFDDSKARLNRSARPLRLAYFSPLPPSKSGIADYSAELLPYLAKGADITVFVEQADELRLHQHREDFAAYNTIHFDEINRQNPFDLSIYHQGNNPHHEYIYERALRMPGLLVLHEHCLHHLVAWRTLGRKDEDAYWNELFCAYGRLGARVAEMRALGVGSEYQQFLMPLNCRLVTGSLGIITHNVY